MNIITELLKCIFCRKSAKHEIENQQFLHSEITRQKIKCTNCGSTSTRNTNDHQPRRQICPGEK